MTTVAIAYGQIDYEGSDTIGVFDSMMAATYRCMDIEKRRASDDDFDCFYHRYRVEKWIVGNTAPVETLYFTREQALRPDATT